MSALSDEFYSREELINKAKENNIPEKYFEEFIKCVEKDLQQMTDDGDFSKEEMKENTIGFSVDFINKFDKELQRGHGEEWAKLYAANDDQHKVAFEDAYLKLKSKDPLQAMEELKIHCKSVGGDEPYTNHFIYLIEAGEGTADPGPDELAVIYSKAYNEQQKNGKSALFAHIYSDAVARTSGGMFFSELACYAEAAEYEKAIIAGYSKVFAQIYSEEIADYIADNYNSYDEALVDKYYAIKKAELEKKYRHLIKR